MNNWNNFKNIKSGSGDILKLEDGKSYKLRFIGEPYVYETEYKGNPSIRFALTVYYQAENKAKIVMLPKTAVGQIYDLIENPDWGDPEDYDITVIKTGQEKETKYSIAPSPKKPLEKDKKAEVESIVLEDVLSRLPSINRAFPLSEVNDPDKLFPKKPAAKTSEDVIIEDVEMPERFLE